MAKNSWITLSVIVFVLIWCALFLSVFLPDSKAKNSDADAGLLQRSLDAQDSPESNGKIEPLKVMREPRRYQVETIRSEPAPLEEVRANMTLYLHTLHSSLAAMAGPHVTAEAVWDSFLDITKKMPMAWDDQNKHRIPLPKEDGSIFVSLGTYRDPYCPMTLKSLYAQAKNPEKLYVALLQQNCFLETCRTGVLVGGKVENMGPDVDCYKEFCKSPEGQRSGACLTDQIRLFNVNESESLGPYMARYLGAKFYR